MQIYYIAIQRQLKGKNKQTNSITRIENGDILCNPILKILDLKPIFEDHYFVHLPNIRNTISSFFYSFVRWYSTLSQVKNGPFITLNNFICRSIQNNMYVFKLLVLHYSNLLILCRTIILCFPFATFHFESHISHTLTIF